MGIEKTPSGVCFFFMAKDSHLGKETALAPIVDSILSKLNQQDTIKVTDKLGQDKVRQSFKILCFSKMSVRYTSPVGHSWMLQCP